MSAGLPGIGIGGLFFILSALCMPFVEIGRTIRGASSAARWRVVGRQSAMAWAIVFAVERMLWLTKIVPSVVDRAGQAGGVRRAAVAAVAQVPTHALPVMPILVTFACLAVVVVGAFALRLISR
ncbi:MAG TPA: hypothetical protein VM784_09675 [Actinomycetota bacterium]|nr:hypothetical protein [Actinomycetota bacterium]